MLIRVVTVVEPAALRERIGGILRQPDVLISPLPRPKSFLNRLEQESCDLVLASRALLPEPAADAIPAVRKLPDRPELILLTATEDPEERAALLTAGAFAVVNQGLSDRKLRATLDALIRRRREGALNRLRAERAKETVSLDDFSPASPAMQKTLAMARRVAGSDSSLLLLGETGVGKEWLARAIHQEGRRAAAPFVAVNCAALPESLLESELLGHERGAFTGAERSRRGYFELAHHGTLFLDEIGEMSPKLQAKLLRAIEERQIRRLGSEEAVPVDVRIMAATHREPEKELAAGAFREDLYYRLAVVSLTVPPLRERREEIPALSDGFLKGLRKRLARPEVEGISEEAAAALAAYRWPGNVRELANVLERAVLLCRGRTVGLADLPEAVVGSTSRGRQRLPALQLQGAFEDYCGRPLEAAREELVAAFEEAYLVRLLEEERGNLGEVARRAGIDRRTLYNKMKAYGLAKRTFRTSPA